MTTVYGHEGLSCGGLGTNRVSLVLSWSSYGPQLDSHRCAPPLPKTLQTVELDSTGSYPSLDPAQVLGDDIIRAGRRIRHRRMRLLQSPQRR